MPSTAANTSTNGSNALPSFIDKIARRSAYVNKSDIMLVSVPTGFNTGASLLLGFPAETTAFTGLMTALTCGGIALMLSDKPTERNKTMLQTYKNGFKAATIGSLVSAGVTGVGVLIDLTDPKWLMFPVTLVADMGYAWYASGIKEQSAARATESGSLDGHGWPQGRE